MQSWCCQSERLNSQGSPGVCPLPQRASNWGDKVPSIGRLSRHPDSASHTSPHKFVLLFVQGQVDVTAGLCVLVWPGL